MKKNQEMEEKEYVEVELSKLLEMTMQLENEVYSMTPSSQ